MSQLFKTVYTSDQDVVWLNIEKGLVYFRNKQIGEGVGANGTLFHGCIGYGTKNQKNCVVKTFPIPNENKLGGYDNIELVLGRKLIHKNIVEFYECDRSHSNYYLFMEYCSGGSLQKLITIPGKEESVFESQKLKESDAISIMSQIIDALMYMKKLIVDKVQGCYHRDLKPDNIMFDDQGTPKLIDFGMGKLNPTSGGVSTFKGSPIYMSPQNLRAQPYDLEKNDVWSIGIILFQLVEGQFPWRCDLESLDDLKNAQEMLKKGSNIKFTEASPNLQKIILLMLKFNEAERATFDQIAQSEIFSDLLSTKNSNQNQVSCILSNYDFFQALQKSFNFPKFDKLVLDITLLEIDKLKKFIAKNSQQEVKINALYLDRIMKTKRKNYGFKRPQYLKQKLQNRLVDLITTLIINEEVLPEENFIKFCHNIISLYNPQVTVAKYQQLEQLLEQAKATI